MIYRFDEVSSTQDVLKAYRRQGIARIGDVVIAQAQRSGRGRYGKSFYSPAMRGIYLSTLLPHRSTELLTVRAGAAVLASIERVTGIAADVEWVNDILFRGKKIAGILAESLSDDNNEPDAVVLGIGLNITEPEGGYPEEIAERAGALLTGETRIELSDDAYLRLQERLVDSLIKNLADIDRPEYLARDIARYRERLVNPCAVPVGALDFTADPAVLASAQPDR